MALAWQTLEPGLSAYLSAAPDMALPGLADRAYRSVVGQDSWGQVSPLAVRQDRPLAQ